jgi:hypothetical protein
LLVPVATDTRQSQDGIIRKGLRRPRLSAIIILLRSPTLILIAAPFSSRLSRYNGGSALKNSSTWLRRSCFRTTTFSAASIP